ncbi:MAG: hypothetical protein ACO25B_08900 [Chitinophagaceae bacterium]
MQTARFGQTVTYLVIVMLAAGCAATKEYSSKLFAPRANPGDEKTAKALRFLDMEESAIDSARWVSTDIITGRDSSDRTAVLDNLARIYPATKSESSQPDSVVTRKETGTIIARAERPREATEPVARNTSEGTVRVKKTREE